MIVEQLMNEATLIGDELIDAAKKTENGWYWETISLDDDHEPYWDTSESLYSGTGGIVYFLIELYKYTGDDKYLEAIEKGAEWLIWYCKNNPTNYYAFFTGRMGVSYLMLQCYDLTRNEHYSKQALGIAEGCESFLDQPYIVLDLINGVSGALLGLLHLHSASGEAWVLEKAALYVERLLDEIKHGEQGIYWDLDHKHTKPLCGFSHGASGIGYVFLELGYYLGNEAFYKIAEQAFVYENFYFDGDHQNWPDFREGIYDAATYEKHKKAYLENDLDFFFKPSFMSAWCHGAPGIGLSRNRAFQLLKKKEYKRDIDRAVNHTYHTMKDFRNHASYNLCHGKGGNALLFIDAYRRFENNEYRKYAIEIAQQAIRSHENLSRYISGYNTAGKQEDTSLFMGKAGVGYFYLQCFKEEGSSSILAPDLNSKVETGHSLPSALAESHHEILVRILKKAYPRTLTLIESKFQKEMAQFFESIGGSDDLKSKLKKFVVSISNESDNTVSSRLKDVLALEEARLKEKIASNPAYFYIQNDLQSQSAQKLLELGDSEIMEKELKLNDIVSFKKTQWNWDMGEPDLWIQNLEKSPDEYHTMFLNRIKEIEEFIDLPEFTRLVFTSFGQSKKVKDAINAIAYSIGIDEEYGREVIFEQVKEGIRARILVKK